MWKQTGEIKEVLLCGVWLYLSLTHPSFSSSNHNWPYDIGKKSQTKIKLIHFNFQKWHSWQWFIGRERKEDIWRIEKNVVDDQNTNRKYFRMKKIFEAKNNEQKLIIGNWGFWSSEYSERENIYCCWNVIYGSRCEMIHLCKLQGSFWTISLSHVCSSLKWIRWSIWGL